MIFLIFESFREWVMKLVGGRTRKNLRAVSCSKEPGRGRTVATVLPWLQVRSFRGGNLPWDEFIAKQGSPEASWLNIKQLTEPFVTEVSSSLQEGYKP
jgi:hypothetical protein